MGAQPLGWRQPRDDNPGGRAKGVQPFLTQFGVGTGAAAEIP